MTLLDGIKVIDAASFIAGPAAATVMADFGADVIKIEPPGVGDAYRNLRTAPGNPPCDYNYAWVLDNRNKRSVALDLKIASGREALYRLVAGADVFVTNLPLPARQRLQVRYDDLRPHNERLIYASLTAYGETGPEANNTGFDSTALWARTSLMDMVRAGPEAPPVRSLPGMGDHPTAISLFGAIMAALYRRERTGKGAYVHTSLMANGLWWNGIQVQAMLTGAEFPRRPGREAATSALHNLYRTRDGRWFHLVVIPEAKRWEPLVAAIERPDLLTDARCATLAARHNDPAALIEILDGVFMAHDWAYWKARFDTFDITYGLVGTLRDTVSDPQMHASGALVEHPDPNAGADFTISSPLWVDDAPKVPPQLAPELGQHTDAVLREWGFGDADLATLRADGAIPEA